MPSVNEWGDPIVEAPAVPSPPKLNEWGDTIEVPEGSALSPAGQVIPMLSPAEEPSLASRALTATREALSPIIGPTPNQRLRTEQENMALSQALPALANAAATGPINKVTTEGFVPAMFTPTEGIPWKAPVIQPDPERGAIASVGAGTYNTLAGAANAMIASPGGLLSLPAAPALAGSRLATGIFAGDMARQTIENLPQTIATVRDDSATLQQKTEAVAGTALTAAMSSLGARQAFRSEPLPAQPQAKTTPAAEQAKPAPIAEILTPDGTTPLSGAEVPGAMRAAMEAEAPPSVAAAPDPTAPKATGEVKPLGLLESARAADTVAPATKVLLEGDYTVQGNAATIAEAARRIDASTTIDEARQTVMAADNPDAVTNAMGLELVRRYQDAGNFSAAAEVLNHMATKAKTQGQAIQILSTLSRSTAEGAAAYAQRLFGRKLTADEFAGIKKDFDWVQSATDPSVRLGRQAIVLGRLQDKIPLGLDSKLAAARNMAMLLNPKTQIRNVVGNVFMAVGDMAADVVALPADAGVSVFTGRRTIAGPDLVEYARGFAQPAREFKAAYRAARAEGNSRVRSLASAADVLHALTKLGDTSKMELGDVRTAYRLTFSSPLMRGLEKTLGLTMGVPDRAFYMGRLAASLKSQMRAGEAVVPTAEMLNRASLEAARSTYQDRNFVSISLGEVRKALNAMSTFGGTKQIGLGSAVLPFTQVPGALLLRGAEFSPIGFVKAASEAVIPLFTKRTFNQREFSQAFSKALVGTGGLAVAGYWLHGLGVVTGAANPDRRVATLERELGLGAYKINVSELKRRLQSLDWATPSKGPQPGDTLVNYDWVQPLALPMAMGADIAGSKNATAINPTQRVLNGMFTGVRTLEEQPLLSGLTGFFSQAAYANEGRGSVVEAAYNTMLALPTSFVPTALRQMRDLVDNRVYETRGSDRMEQAWDAVVTSIPAAAEKLGYKPRVNSLGAPIERMENGGNSFFNVLINPAMVTRMKTNPQLREVYRIWQQSGATDQIPGQAGARLTINGEPRLLTAGERADYQQFIGRLTRDGFVMLMASPNYAKLPNEMRAKVLGEWVSAADVAARVELFGDRPKGGTNTAVAAILLSRKRAAQKAQ